MGTEEHVEPLECIRRLKRWFIGGALAFNEDKWPLAERRSCHLGYGGRRLRELASDLPENPLYGVPDEELNHMIVAAAPT